MRIDESLARGLTKELFNKLDEEYEKFVTQIAPFEYEYAGDLTRTKAANRFCKRLDAVAAKSPIILHHGTTGSRNHTHWWAIYLKCHAHLQDDAWRERVLSIDIERIWLLGQRPQPTYSNAFIGEHCIARLFQRTPWASMPKSFSVFDELRYLTEVLPWHIAAHGHIAQLHNGLRLSKFIPTPHGVFLGVSHPTDVDLMKLATFVSFDQLSDFQKQLWVYLFAVQSQSEIRQHFGLLLDPTNKLAEQHHQKWRPVTLQLIFYILNFAGLLQRELNALHPEVLWSESKFELTTWDERRELLMDGFNLKDEFHALLRSEIMEKRRESARKRAEVLATI